MSKAGHNLLQIAQVLKSNGTDGELVVGFREMGPEEIDLNEPVFIIFDGLPVPFFIESLVRRGSRKALVHLTDICTKEDAEELVGKAVLSDADSLPQPDLETDGFKALIGWILLAPSEGSIDDNKEELEVEEIGEISDYIEIPNNPCIEVDTKNGTAMIPFHEDLIISVDPENQEIIMARPEGLI